MVDASCDFADRNDCRGSRARAGDATASAHARTRQLLSEMEEKLAEAMSGRGSDGAGAAEREAVAMESAVPRHQEGGQTL